MKKKVVYTLPYETEEDIRQAQEFRQELYEKYNDVGVYPNGLYEVQIICKDEII